VHVRDGLAATKTFNQRRGLPSDQALSATNRTEFDTHGMTARTRFFPPSRF
jgi:hypothetical protein